MCSKSGLAFLAFLSPLDRFFYGQGDLLQTTLVSWLPETLGIELHPGTGTGFSVELGSHMINATSST